MTNIFQNIVEDAPEAIFIHVNGIFAYLNPAACRLFGVRYAGELTGTSIVERVRQDFKERVRERIRLLCEVRAPEIIPVEQVIITAGGEEVWIESSGKSIEYEGKPAGLIFARDITRRKRTQHFLRENEEKYRNLFRDHAAVKLIIDPVTGMITDANTAAERFYGWTIAELKGMNISEINCLPPEEITYEMSSVRASISNHFVFRHRTASGSIRDVEVFSSSIIMEGKEYLHSIVHDVTEKQAAERQLKLLSRSVEQSPVSVLITDIDGNIEYVNPGFEKITGYTFDEVIGKNPRILKSGYLSPEFYSRLWSTILSGKEWSGEFRNRKKNGELYWEQTIISPVTDSSGKVTNFVSIREDITERKKLVAELVTAKEKAEESDRLKSAFLANMSHEIRTPMNGILGFSEILKSPGLSREQQRKFIGIIESSGRRMLDTVNDLIDISKIETGQVKLYISETNLKRELEELHQFFLPQARVKDLELILKEPVPAEFAVMETDRSKINSILTNLIKNAIKFTDEGKIEVGCRLKGEFLEFYVSDTGIGVSADRQSAIFNRFEQADIEDEKAFQGSGLGLAIAKSYVEMLGGEIRLVSAPGKGSVFSFTLPCSGAAADRSQPVKKDKSRGGIPDLEGKNILLSEDDLFSREMMAYLLEKTGARVVFANDGIETLRKFEDEEIDLVLLDIQLPGINGFDILKKLRSADPGLVIIAQTAYALLEDINKIRNAGFTDYLAKPIRQDRLYGLLSRYLTDLHAEHRVRTE